MESVVNWAYDNKKKMEEQTYIELMDKLKVLYENPTPKDHPHRHKVKVSLHTQFRVASDEWIQGEGGGGEEYESDCDADEEEIEIETSDYIYIFLNKRECIVNDFSIETEDKLYRLLLSNSRFSSKDHIFGSSHLHKRHIEKVVNCVSNLERNKKVYRVKDTERFIDYIRVV